MEMISLIKVLSIGTVAAAGTGSAAYFFRKEISKAFNKKTENFDSRTVEHIEQQFIYVIAQYKSFDTDALTDQVEKKYEFVVKYKDSKDQLFIDKDVNIHPIDKPKNTSDGINFSTSIVASNKLSYPLTNAQTYYVRLSKLAYDAIKVSKTFKIADPLEPSKEFGSFSLLSGAVSEIFKGERKSIEFFASNLFVVKIASVESALTLFSTPSDLTCSIGSAKTNITCNAFKFVGSDEPTTQEKYVGLTPVATPSSEIAVDKFILIELEGVGQRLSDLEHQVVVFKKQGSQEIAKGLVEQVLVGSIDTEIYLVEGSQGKLTPVVQEPTLPSKYLLTKGGILHPTIKDENPNGANYICSVVEETKKYIDEACKLFKLDTTGTNFYFDKSKYADDTSEQLGASDDLGPTKYQVVKLSKVLADKLNTKVNGLFPKLEIIRKSSKNAAWNNKLVSLTAVKELVGDGETWDKPKTNLMLVRAKANGAASISIDANAEFSCAIGTSTVAGTFENCKLYTFNGTAKNTNKIGGAEFDLLKTGAAITTPVKADDHYVLELINSKKSLDELKNKEIVLKLNKSPNTEVGKFLFDQLVIGQIHQASALLKSKELMFIVEKTTPAEDVVDLTKPYRCKFASATSGDVVNFDDTCSLTKLPALSADKKILTLPEIKKPSTETSNTLNLKTDNDDFYRLIFDANKLYNIVLTTFAGLNINIEILPVGDETAKKFGTVKLAQNITAETTSGKVNLIVGKVKTGTPNVTTLADNQCAFNASSITTFACTLYKDNPTSGTNADVTKANFSQKTEVANGDLNEGKLVLIKLTDAKNISELVGKSIVYKPKTGVATNVVEFEIAGILGGAVDSSKKAYLLNKLTT